MTMLGAAKTRKQRCCKPLSVVCDRGKGRHLGELKATFSTALKVLQCSKTINSHSASC